MARSADLHRVLLHHLAERLDPSRQAEPIETGGNLFHGFAHRAQHRWRQSGRSCDIAVHGVAFLSSEFSTPSLPAQGEQRRPSFFNIRRDIADDSRWRPSSVVSSAYLLSKVATSASTACASSARAPLRNTDKACGSSGSQALQDAARKDFYSAGLALCFLLSSIDPCRNGLLLNNNV